MKRRERLSEWRLAKLHLHGRGLVLPSLILIAAAAFAGYSTRGIRDGGPWTTWGMIAIAIGFFFGLLPIIGWLRHRVVVTSNSTTQFHGFFGMKKRVMQHHHVDQVSLRQNGWQKLFGSGDVMLNAYTGQRLVLHDVPNAVTVAQAMRELTGTMGTDSTGFQPRITDPAPPQPHS